MFFRWKKMCTTTCQWNEIKLTVKILCNLVFIWSDLPVCTKLAQFTTSACITQNTHTLVIGQGYQTTYNSSKVDEQHVGPIYESSQRWPNVLKNFRPASNLSFVSKPTEKIVLDQFLCHLDQNNLWHTIQSAYLPKHSTKTIRIFSDHLTASDSGSISIPTLLPSTLSIITSFWLASKTFLVFVILLCPLVPTCKVGHK